MTTETLLLQFPLPLSHIYTAICTEGYPFCFQQTALFFPTRSRTSVTIYNSMTWQIFCFRYAMQHFSNQTSMTRTAYNSVHDRSELMLQHYKLPCEMPLYLQPFVLQIVLIKKERRNLVRVKPIPFISLHCCPPKRNSNGLPPLKPSTPKRLPSKDY